MRRPRRRRGARAAAATVAVAAIAAVASPAAQAAARHPVTRGTIAVGRGAAGVVLGMPRTQVLARLGRPYYENRNGYMQYVPDGGSGLFDVYRAGGARTSRVRMVSIAGRGSGWRLADGNAIFAPGGLRRLVRRFGSRVRLTHTAEGEPLYRIASRLGGRRVATDFFPDRPTLDGRVMQIFIEYG